MNSLSVSLVLAALVLGGCSSGGGSSSNTDGGNPGSSSGGTSCTPQSPKGVCVSGDAGVTGCIAFTGSSFTMSSSIQEACNVISATMASSCPTTMRLGGCVSGCGTAAENISYFYQGGIYTNTMQVMQACTQQNAAFVQ